MLRRVLCSGLCRAGWLAAEPLCVAQAGQLPVAPLAAAGLHSSAPLAQHMRADEAMSGKGGEGPSFQGLRPATAGPQVCGSAATCKVAPALALNGSSQSCNFASCNVTMAISVIACSPDHPPPTARSTALLSVTSLLPSQPPACSRRQEWTSWGRQATKFRGIR